MWIITLYAVFYINNFFDADRRIKLESFDYKK